MNRTALRIAAALATSIGAAAGVIVANPSLVGAVFPPGAASAVSLLALLAVAVLHELAHTSVASAAAAPAAPAKPEEPSP